MPVVICLLSIKYKTLFKAESNVTFYLFNGNRCKTVAMYKNFMEWNKPVQVLFYVLLYSLIQSRSQVVRMIFIKWLQVQALESRSVNKALASLLFPFGVT